MRTRGYLSIKKEIKKAKLTLYIQSESNIITNSSSELFCVVRSEHSALLSLLFSDIEMWLDHNGESSVSWRDDMKSSDEEKTDPWSDSIQQLPEDNFVKREGDDHDPNAITIWLSYDQSTDLFEYAIRKRCEEIFGKYSYELDIQ
jgi:hypothetical protein